MPVATIVTIEDKWFDRLFRLDGVRILLVEDATDVRDQVVSILETCGGTVTAVRSALTALEVLEHQRPDVLVSDVSLPDRDGFWLIGKVRALSAARGGQTPAAAITAVATPEARAEILGSGFQFHVRTPIDPGRLAGVITLLALKE